MVSALLFLRQSLNKSNRKKRTKSKFNYDIFNNIIIDIDKLFHSPYTVFTKYERRLNYESKF